MLEAGGLNSPSAEILLVSTTTDSALEQLDKFNLKQAFLMI